MKVFLIIIGIVSFIVGAIWKYRLKKYAFDNTTNGGTVEFKSYGKYNLHLFSRALSSLMLIFGLGCAVYGQFFYHTVVYT